MTETGKFNTNSAALVNRIAAHNKFGSNDLNGWIFEHLGINEGSHVLDLGCGTGKQSLAIAGQIGEAGTVTSVDLSEESLEALNKQAAEQGMSGRITTVRSDLDSIDSHISQAFYDIVVSSYALYYTNEVENMFSVIHKALKPGGIVFFCGPSKQNNAELKKFHYSLGDAPLKLETFASEFMENDGVRAASKIFGKVDASEFTNPLRFNSPEALHEYWSSYNLYDEKFEAAFKEKAAIHFGSNEYFETVKRVIGVKAVKESD